jgi:hypothetical protein
MGVYLLGWLGSELTLRVAVIAGDISPWLALVLFAFNFVCVLTAAIVILSLAGRELGIRELLPADEREIDDRDTSLSRLVAITLLPFPWHVRSVRPGGGGSESLGHSAVGPVWPDGEIELVSVSAVLPAFLLTRQVVLAVDQVPDDEANRGSGTVAVLVLEHH